MFFEGKRGEGFANDFLSTWFRGDKTFAIPAGNGDGVLAAVAGLRAVGVAGASVIGLIDRDFYSDGKLQSVPDGVIVLAVHEIEGVLCDREAISALAIHFGRSADEVWKGFLDCIRNTFTGREFNYVVAQRVRARVSDLLRRAYDNAAVESDFEPTVKSHSAALGKLCLPDKVGEMFLEEKEQLDRALKGGESEMLAILPSKRLLGLLPSLLGMRDTKELTGLILRALDTASPNNSAVSGLGAALEKAFGKYLPARSI